MPLINGENISKDILNDINKCILHLKNKYNIIVYIHITYVASHK